MVRAALIWNKPVSLTQIFYHLVVVAGHTHCGGCKGAWEASTKPPTTDTDVPLIRWLTPLVKLAISLNLASRPQAEGVDILVSPTLCCDSPTITHLYKYIRSGSL